MYNFALGGINFATPDYAAEKLCAERPHPRRVKHLALAMLLLPLFAGGVIAARADSLVDKVHAANDRFEDVAQAKAEGYQPIPCVSGIDGGAMGVHFVNGALITDGAVDIAHPQAVMYEPDATGAMRLVAVEYITTKGPANLGGQLFSFTGAPNRYGLPAFYELHVWAWKANPKGAYADMNPDVSCDAAPMAGM